MIENRKGARASVVGEAQKTPVVACATRIALIDEIDMTKSENTSPAGEPR